MNWEKSKVKSDIWAPDARLATFVATLHETEGKNTTVGHNVVDDFTYSNPS